MYFAIPNEKQNGDREIIRSHLEDLALHAGLGMVVSSYSIGEGGDFLEVYLEPYRYIDHPLDCYAIEIEHRSKREIEWVKVSQGGFLSAYIRPKGIIRSVLGGKCTKLYVRSQKKLKEEEK